MRALENSAADYACLINDVFSYQKEIEFEGELHNGVLVVQNFLDCDYPTRRRRRQRPDDLAHGSSSTSRRRSSRSLDDRPRPDVRERVLAYVSELEDWMAGILNWHRECGRYKDALLATGRPAGGPRGLPPPRPLGPTGLGTSAARVPPLPIGSAGR